MPEEQRTIYTIGYQGRTVEELHQAMAQHHIELLIDVRSKPYGRLTAFNRKRLEALIPGYRWMGDRLGGFGEITDQAIADLAALAQSSRVLLMCMERDPLQCHRQYELAARLQNHGFKAIHL